MFVILIPNIVRLAFAHVGRNSKFLFKKQGRVWKITARIMQVHIEFNDFFSRLFLSFSKVSKSRNKVLSEGNHVWQMQFITWFHRFFSVFLLQVYRVLGSTCVCVLENGILTLVEGPLAYSTSAWWKLLGNAHLGERQTWSCRWRCKLQESPFPLIFRSPDKTPLVLRPPGCLFRTTVLSQWMERAKRSRCRRAFGAPAACRWRSGPGSRWSPVRAGCPGRSAPGAQRREQCGDRNGAYSSPWLESPASERHAATSPAFGAGH